MSETLVTLTIEGLEAVVPKGTLLVDAAKQVGIDIPVFCYHPKMHPAGACRMCLVEIGRPQIDRKTREVIKDQEGNPLIRFGPNLETACNLPVGEGWVVKVNSEKAIQGRRQIIEFLLTSHPLDCPVCDKGGECPLQNLTMAHGPGKSRFLFDEKMHLAKHLPLGDLIFLDRERCIQCSRCVRFQNEIAADPVISFTQRSRGLEITTFSDPGFDSYFSGNTTDICPVGALTTADFRFLARPWELNAAASICPHCAVGCNIMINTRREAKSGGHEVIKRVMPRQNEAVNEIWICDKGRFGHHFATSGERLKRPLVRVDGELIQATWEEALSRAAEGLQTAGSGSDLIGIAGGRASNEDLFTFRGLVEGMGGRTLLYHSMAGGDLVQLVGPGAGSDLGRLGQGDAIMVVASDLHEEAPIWWLRVKQAVERGAVLVEANARTTPLTAYAAHRVHAGYGTAIHVVLNILRKVSGGGELGADADAGAIDAAAKAIAEAENLLVFYGQEGLSHEGSGSLAQACANLLIASGHTGRANNGLIAVWAHPNTQGAWDMGLRPVADLSAALDQAGMAYVLAADPAGDDPELGGILGRLDFLVVQELFLSETAELADVVFPGRSFAEREGSYTSGDRRVQRFYPAIPPQGESLADWRILAALGTRMGLDLEAGSASAVMEKIRTAVPDYANLGYPALSEVKGQWPPVGGENLYFGGTAFPNSQGLGVRAPSAAERGEKLATFPVKPAKEAEFRDLLLVPIYRLYDQGTTLRASGLLAGRIAPRALALNAVDAARLNIPNNAEVELRLGEGAERVRAVIDDRVPEGAALLPRSSGFPLLQPREIQIAPVK